MDPVVRHLATAGRMLEAGLGVQDWAIHLLTAAAKLRQRGDDLGRECVMRIAQAACDRPQLAARLIRGGLGAFYSRTCVAS